MVAVELLRGTPLPTDLRAAILRAIALIPGIEQHAERDIMGRPGVGVAYDGSQGRQALIFDPSTYELLGDRSGAGRHRRPRVGHRRLDDRAPVSGPASRVADYDPAVPARTEAEIAVVGGGTAGAASPHGSPQRGETCS